MGGDIVVLVFRTRLFSGIEGAFLHVRGLPMLHGPICAKAVASRSRAWKLCKGGDPYVVAAQLRFDEVWCTLDKILGARAAFGVA
jgi:hypothetical protein